MTAENGIVMKVSNVLMSEILFDEDFNCRGPILPMDVINLANSIKEEGLLQPVVVGPLTGHRLNASPNKKYLLIAGYRRFTAFKVNQETHIPAVIKDKIIDEETARFFNLSENLQRSDLNFMQEALAIKKLKDIGITDTVVASRLGMGRGWAQVRFMALDLPEEVQAEIAAGWLTQIQIRDAYTHLVKEGKDACFAAVKSFKDDKLKGRKGTRKKVKRKGARKNYKRIRSQNDIFEMQEHIYGEFRGNSIVTKTLAWVAGMIDDREFNESMLEFAKSLGKPYRALD